MYGQVSSHLHLENAATRECHRGSCYYLSVGDSPQAPTIPQSRLFLAAIGFFFPASGCRLPRKKPSKIFAYPTQICRRPRQCLPRSSIVEAAFAFAYPRSVAYFLGGNRSLITCAIRRQLFFTRSRLGFVYPSLIQLLRRARSEVLKAVTHENARP